MPNNTLTIKKTIHWVAYIGPFSFPADGAAARRILGNAYSIHEAGYNVTIVSGQKEITKKEELPSFLTVASTGERTAEHLPAFLKRAIYFFMGRKTYKWLEEQQTKPKYIILYSGYTPYILWMKHFCKKYDIPLYFDAVEWYQQDGLLKNIISPYQLNIELSMRFLLPKLDGLIVISSYLQNYYGKKLERIIKVPPTLKINDVIPNLQGKTNNTLKLAYTGTPAKKDSLNEAFEAIDKAVLQGSNITFHLAGITESDVLSYPFYKNRNVSSLPKHICCYGRISHEASINLVKSSDFSILFRVPDRMSSAGFSTKMVESLSVGTPLLANITGDMGNYLVDSENAVLCNFVDSDQIFSTLLRAYSLNTSEHAEMRKRSRNIAEKEFDYKKYILSFQNNLFV